MDITNCKNCKSNDILTVSVFKHQWNYCNNCHNAFSEKNKTLPFWTYFLPKRFRDIKVLVGNEDSSTTYDKYASDVRKQKVIELAAVHLKKFKDVYNIDVAGKKVLDLSGGNAHYILQYKNAGAAKIVFTEYSQHLVDYAKNLGIEAYRYDLNSNVNLTELLNQQFDLIIFKGNIMFSLRPDKLFLQLYKILNTSGKIINLDCHELTEAVAVRWCHDDYTHLVCWNNTAIDTYSKENGFKILNKEQHDEPNYFTGLSIPKKVFFGMFRRRFKKQVKAVKANSSLHSETYLAYDYVLEKN